MQRISVAADLSDDLISVQGVQRGAVLRPLFGADAINVVILTETRRKDILTFAFALVGFMND